MKTVTKANNQGKKKNPIRYKEFRKRGILSPQSKIGSFKANGAKLSKPRGKVTSTLEFYTSYARSIMILMSRVKNRPPCTLG